MLRDFISEIGKAKKNGIVDLKEEFSHKKKKIIKIVNPQKKEIVYELYKIINNSEDFLFKISFFLNDKIIN
jgi:hypothetical protein